MNGKCDCIEVERDPDGCMIPAADFPVRLYPIEYKHGRVRDEREYNIQLCAQAICLEEMYGTEIPRGAVFYISSHKRMEVEFTAELRRQVSEVASRLRGVREEFGIPSGEYGSKCKRCSLAEYCMPGTRISAVQYCERLASEAVGGIELCESEDLT